MAPRLFALASLALALTRGTWGYDNSRNDNLVVYYGQNSYGATNSNQAGWQKNLATYCQDDNINVLPIAFLNRFFSSGNQPEINLSSTCGTGNGVFSGTNLANCQFMSNDIKTCQSKGKLVTISLGGATGSSTFSSDSQASSFADTIWNLFLGGKSSTRPFGDAVLDGVDLDIEGGSNAHFIVFAQRLKTLMNGGSKKFYLTAAPQCPFPDAFIGGVLNAVSFDSLYIQVFYNNYCGLQNFNNSNWNFGTWDNWAKNTSPNKSVKLFIGAPAAGSAAGSGYVGPNTLGSAAKATKSKYSSFGGVMLWDASQAYANGRYDTAIKNALKSSKEAASDDYGVPNQFVPEDSQPNTPYDVVSASTPTIEAGDIATADVPLSTPSAEDITTPINVDGTNTSDGASVEIIESGNSASVAITSTADYASATQSLQETEAPALKRGLSRVYRYLGL